MIRTPMTIDECCAWCRRPVSLCTDSACDSTTTYSGTLVRGRWVEVGDRDSSIQDRVPAGRARQS